MGAVAPLEATVAGPRNWNTTNRRQQKTARYYVLVPVATLVNEEGRGRRMPFRRRASATAIRWITRWVIGRRRIRASPRSDPPSLIA
jgi:hypothetical protein